MDISRYLAQFYNLVEDKNSKPKYKTLIADVLEKLQEITKEDRVANTSQVPYMRNIAASAPGLAC